MSTTKLCCTNESQLKHLKRELQILLQQLQADLDAERSDQKQEMSQLSSTEVLDRAEASAVVGLQLTSLSRVKQLEEEIHECQNALERIEAGRYGYCEQCGEEIELNRLMANPTSVLCVGCQSKDELKRNGRQSITL
ncbi:TraR/DksA family transcriptional regulator [Amphritea sp. 2_MG-2023]|uniref:TraR/DksA family transcriptional regulator n=1 Tax=Amphritea TaxID=515417 RepID=UPI001C07174A|nr:MULTISPECIES: TraR/DksA family transcriptional regulator [Amphritea]MBU2966459.1 TraR/DksA family transcriptional regulator [Amphritea atlantica]MDO6417682.1 TraR/DksA family transcriptional regulator [Amphritea sp. 2_MG-2023]MDX2422539.1 TraR/DksA family transcriptional regulator [Amphritea sp.]